MQAKFVNEISKFERGLDPKSAMGIGRLGALEQKYDRTFDFSPNELLIVAIRENFPDVANYALEAGANVIWYEKHSNVTNGRKDEYLTAPYLSKNFVIIKKINYVTDYKGDQFISNVVYKNITNQIFGNGKSINGTSNVFRIKFKPVDWQLEKK